MIQIQISVSSSTEALESMAAETCQQPENTFNDTPTCHEMEATRPGMGVILQEFKWRCGYDCGYIFWKESSGK